MALQTSYYCVSCSSRIAAAYYVVVIVIFLEPGCWNYRHCIEVSSGLLVPIDVGAAWLEFEVIMKRSYDGMFSHLVNVIARIEPDFQADIALTMLFATFRLSLGSKRKEMWWPVVERARMLDDTLFVHTYPTGDWDNRIRVVVASCVRKQRCCRDQINHCGAPAAIYTLRKQTRVQKCMIDDNYKTRVKMEGYIDVTHRSILNWSRPVIRPK